MHRTELIKWIEDHGCRIAKDVPEGSFYRNVIEGEPVWIPKDDWLDDIAVCDILFELNVDPPNELNEIFIEFVRFRRHTDGLSNG